MAKRNNIQVDWLLLLLYFILILIGWLAIYTADYDDRFPEIYNTTRAYGRQLFWISASLLIGFLIQLFDSRFYTTFAYVIYGITILMLLLVLGMGSEISGSKSWFRIGSFGMQPAEFAKFGTCLAVAKYLSSTNATFRNFNSQIIGFALLGLPMFLTLLQGDAGTALVFTGLVLMFYREGLSGGFLIIGAFLIILFVLGLMTNFYWLFGIISFLGLIFLILKEGYKIPNLLTYVVAIAATIAATIFLPQITFIILFLAIIIACIVANYVFRKPLYLLLSFVFFCSIYVKSIDYAFNNILQPHQQNRIGVVLGTIQDNKGVGYNLNQSKIAIGSGGIWGKGFLQGTQNKGNFVPELSTDFIFCTIGEEFGFVGCTVLILLFLLLFYRIITIAERQQSRFTRVYAYGVASILFFHFTINISMTIGLVPVIGIPLPFISYGGSSLIGFSILMFILIKLDSERKMYF